MIWIGEGDLGSLVTPEEALVSALDHGITVGDGVFETLKVDNGQAFALSRHLRRLENSAAVLGLRVPSSDVIRLAVDEVLMANAANLTGQVRLRITVTGGLGPLGIDRGHGGSTLIVAVMSSTQWPQSAEVVTVPWSRNERSAITGAKTISYAENLVAMSYARERGASEAIFANTQGNLCEGTGSNVFVVVDGVTMTPPLTSGCLAGITRELVLEWTPAVERELPLNVLQSAQEIFLTSSTRDVHPVTRVDDRVLRIGPVTMAIRDAFRSASAADIDP
jgi:branched-chain amino acid aminotransferase